ncbi:hypothetical protein C9374_009850 [Naegleria lovaniensis]|uniref:Guanine nucleotide-binding protein subunit beta-like protein n=1 Tax=Naegleria lovaniensis TaxID=51637 RepID=A0AA88GCW7_NAELO|nr:uncharacterized protein C9374_009850 [Naegleria lovaniensis]KAG2375227.1 hypothetical protein C9374_009850 [Naegleria lovaniensis]
MNHGNTSDHPQASTTTTTTSAAVNIPRTSMNENVSSPVGGDCSPTLLSKYVLEMEEKVERLFQQLEDYKNIIGIDLEEEHFDLSKLISYIKLEAGCSATKPPSSLRTPQQTREVGELTRSGSFSNDKNLYSKSPVKTPTIPDNLQKTGPKTTIQLMKNLKDQFNAQIKKTITKQPDKKIIRRYLFHRDAIFDIKMSPICSIDTSTPLFATASADTTCCLWGSNLSHLNPLLVYKGHTGAVNKLKFHPTAQIICSVSGDQSIHLWKYAETLKQNEAVSLNKTDSRSSQMVGENDDDDFSNGRFKAYLKHVKLPSVDNLHKSGEFNDESNERTQHNDLFTQDLLDSHIDFKAYQNEGVNTDSENDDSLNELQKFYITEEGVQGMIRNRPTYLRNPHVKNSDSHKGIISSCDWTNHNKGEQIVTSCWDGNLRIFNLELREIQKIASPSETAYLNDVACAYQSSLIASASSDGNVFLWDSHSDSKSPISALKSHADPVNCVALLQVIAGGVNSVSISEYHQRMLVSLDKRVAKIYDLSGHLHSSLHGHDLMVTSACWSFDGSTCFTAGIDRQIIQHEVQSSSVGAEAKGATVNNEE